MKAIVHGILALPIRALKRAGMKNLILTNAAGGLDLSYNPGEVMVIQDHINATGANPLIGPHSEGLGRQIPRYE